jgi:hypothetical protein
MPLSTFPEEVGDYSLITLIRVFSQPSSSTASVSASGPIHPHLHTSGPQTHPIIILFNALITNKNVIFLGHRRPAGEVSMFVLAACALASGCGAILQRGFIERAFPYANLNNRDEWEGVKAYIAGVTNPIFEASKSWDLLCDIGTGTVTVAKDIHSKWPVGNISLPSLNPSSNSSSNSLITPLLTRTGTLKAETLLGSDDQHNHTGDAKPGPEGGLNIKLDSKDLALSGNNASSADNAFIEDIKTAIEYHYGESLVRLRFMEYVGRFVRLASRWEEETSTTVPPPSTGVGNGDAATTTDTKLDVAGPLASRSRTKIGYPSTPFQPTLNKLGSGLIFNDESLGLKELVLNAHRIEGWRAGGQGQSYVYFVEDFATHIQTAPIRSFDVAHQIFRLRHVHYTPSTSGTSAGTSGLGGSKGMSVAEAQAIYRTLADGVKTYEQVVEFLSHLTPHTGFLLPLAFGLFHQKASVRDATIELFDTLRGFDVGTLFLQSLNHFQRYAYVRLAHAKEAKKMLETQQTGGSSLYQQQQLLHGQGQNANPGPAQMAYSGQPPPYPGPPPPIYSNTNANANMSTLTQQTRSHSNSSASLIAGSYGSYGTDPGSSYGSGGTGVGSLGSNSSYGTSTSLLAGSSYGSGESRLNGSY